MWMPAVQESESVNKSVASLTLFTATEVLSDAEVLFFHEQKSRHTCRVSCSQESVRKARETHVCYLREPKTRQFLPFVVQKLLS